MSFMIKYIQCIHDTRAMSKLPEVKETDRYLVLYWFNAWAENCHLTIYHYYALHEHTYHFLLENSHMSYPNFSLHLLTV